MPVCTDVETGTLPLAPHMLRWLPGHQKRATDLGLSDKDRTDLKDRLATHDLEIHTMRFSEDPLCPSERIDAAVEIGATVPVCQ